MKKIATRLLQIKNVSRKRRRSRQMGAHIGIRSFKWNRRGSRRQARERVGPHDAIFKRIGKDWKVVHVHSSPDNAPVNRPVFDSERERIEKVEKPDKPTK